MQDKKKLHNSKVEIYYWAEFDFAYNQIYREAVTIIPNSAFRIPNSEFRINLNSNLSVRLSPLAVINR